MLELLQARGRIGGPELSRRLEVGERTVRRYAVMLQEMGVPVEGERGRYGAYSLKRGYKMPPMLFTDEEALGLALGLLAARNLGLAGVAPAVEGALAKLERVMPEALRGRVRNLEETVSIAVARPATPAKSETLLTLAAAMGERRRVRLRYRSGWAGESERAVDLYGVMQREGYWYAAGHCHLRGGLRLFRVDRVLEAEMLEETFTCPASLDSPEAVLNAVANAVANTSGGEWSVEVLLNTEAEDARGQVTGYGARTGANGRGDAFTVFDRKSGLDSAHAGRPRLLLHGAATGRAPGGARAACREYRCPLKAHRESGTLVESARLQDLLLTPL
jgi:predicted DNA-binding transcriptional regulator YafY